MFNTEALQIAINKQIAKDKPKENWNRVLELHEPKPKDTTASPLSPKKALLLGGLLDAASTYAFLKQGKMQEDNKMFGYLNKSPESILPTALVSGVGYGYLYDKLKKKYPKVADTVGGLLGGFHMGLGAENIEGMTGNNSKSSYDKLAEHYRNRLDVKP